jgi:hypothetical protein
MEDNLTEHQKILLEIVDGIDAYIKEHEHQQVRDPCKGIYILSNLVKRLIKVRLPRLADNNDNPVPNSKELILLAKTDWHNREERKHRYEMIPWTMGWMTGFLSERKPYWPKVHEAAVRKDEREKVLSIINEENNARLKGLEILFATPADKRAELAQDVYLKEAYFELTLVKHLIESLRPTTPTQEPPHGP